MDSPFNALSRSQNCSQKITSQPPRNAGAWRTGIAPSLLCGLLAACSGGGTSDLGPDPGTSFSATDDGVVTDSEVVAILKMQAPATEDFILSATLPVPRGTFTEGALTVPISVAGVGDIAVPTQIEIVSRYPDGSDGADVIHILAHVRRPEGASPGDSIEYKVGLNPHSKYELELEPDPELLLQAPGAIKLMAKDPMGHTYTADLLTGLRDGSERAEVQLDGVCARRIKTHEVLMPSEPVTGALGTLPHMMGVHSYLTVFRGMNHAQLDLHIHNGMDGRDSSVASDDLLDDLYFKDLKLRLPSGWHVAFAFDSPGQGTVNQTGGYTTTDLVEAQSGGKMHLMPKMSHFVRRLVLYRTGWATQARELARSQNVAFCQPGMAPIGLPQWSWWNAETARYYPQNHRLPELDYMGLNNVNGRLSGDLNRFETQLAAGVSGNYPYESPRLGWAHPWSVAYGGMPGGDEINTYDGLKTAWAASRDGLRLSQLRMGGMVDRQPQVLINASGEPTQYQDLVVRPENRQPYIPLWFYNVPTPGDLFFNFDEAPSFQEDYVASQGMEPSYTAELRNYKPNDYQHFIRYTHDMKTLAWLSNDALSKDLLEMAAENYRLSYHEYANSNYDHLQVTGLKNALLTVATNPGIGVPMGRGESWGIDAALSAYAFGDTALRERYMPWFDMISTVLEDGQSTCTGNLMSYRIWNHFSGQYRVRQAMENAFLENVLLSMASTVYSGVDDAKVETLERILVDSVRCSMTGRFWNETEAAPYFNNAVGPADVNGGNFCWDAPSGTSSPYVNRTEYYSSLAYAYELSGDSFFLFRASQILGGGDALSRLQEGQGANLVNTAGLVALLQDLETSQP
ncbi:MAG: hypothetical protein ACI9X4_000765 [Glaciecola sp.]|jgi:hypothetical protein